MKRLILMMLLVLGGVFSSVAQQKQPTAEEVAKKNVDEMEKRLNLSATQKSVIYNYAFTLAKEQLALYKKQQASGYNDEEMTKYYKFQNETNKSIKSILKPEQIIEYDKLTEERLSGIDPNKKKKKKKGEEEDKIVGIEGLKKNN
ncbi:hypothetical protein [Pedobacter sp. Hv1]|uniref:hypothetical protein n=1 Tax=Pedobacter sp. Hv1 TaxID=1740090 RepID=UPI0006D89F5E|nr:hypothetical protein [Pedobacter sp. Hv1]KQB99243.1 hypothetical protein AQF98_16850 [Pedobacter sp. Hv1]